jgi:hypothetical protein
MQVVHEVCCGWSFRTFTRELLSKANFPERARRRACFRRFQTRSAGLNHQLGGGPSRRSPSIIIAPYCWTTP